MTGFVTLIFLTAVPYLLFLFGIRLAIRSLAKAQPIEGVVTGKRTGERSMLLGVGGLGLSVLQYRYTDASGQPHEEKIYVNVPEWKAHEVSQKISLMKVPDPLFSTSTIYTKASFDSRYNILKKVQTYYYALGVIILIAIISGSVI